MHPSSMNNMQKCIDMLNLNKNLNILDVGGRGLKKDRSYYKLLETYTKKYDIADITEGLNVNIVMPEFYSIPVDDNHYDLIVSGQTLEHVFNPFKLVLEMKRVLKPNGHMIIIVPSSGPRHDTVDCWRFMDDAFKAIADDCQLEIIANWVDREPKDDRSFKWQDNVFIGKKPNE